MGLEADTDGGHDGGGDAGEDEAVIAEGDDGREDVREDQECEDLVALAEVAGGDYVEEDDGGEEECGEFVGAG